ncbi:arginine--tRNA ligase, partial [Patescibacteria group bacterium]|nr:arginine--tRNA ligase [Patescibacteria group bacterium]
KIVDLSLTEFGRTYKMLGVKIDYAHGESFYVPMLTETIREIKKAGISKKSQGAEIVEFAKMPPAMIEKSNGATTYFTRDLATIAYRIKEWQPDLMVYEVGVDQELHFRQLFEVARLMGWTKKCRLFHVAHGLIRWKDAKFSTRKGQTIHLEEVIEKAIEKAKIAAKKSQVVKSMNEAQREKTIEAVAVGAIKLADLMSDPRKDVVFDWERVMSLEGNSGPYLQYTYARVRSVLKKSEIREQKNMEVYDENWVKEEEVLLRYLGRFEEKIVEAGERFSPAVLVEYLLNLARIYNEFYAKYKIIGEKEEVRRIFLSKTTSSVLKTGLELLGIEAIEEM